MRQTTIHRSIECSGIGLHSGRKVTLRLHPASEDSGITFLLKNGNGSKYLKPTPENVVATGLATTLASGGHTVATVEHLMAALRGLGIDNILIEVEGDEVPIMDGSAASFVFLLRSAGLVSQNKPLKVLRIKQPFTFSHDGKWVKAKPYGGVRIEYTIDFPHPQIGTQTMQLDVTPETFASRLAKARTFGFLRDVEMLQKNGLALGGSLDNAVVLDDYAVVNKEGLRYKDEFVRHKILDFIGDTALLDAPLWGQFSVHCSGHAVNNAFMRALNENRDIYLEEVSLPLPETSSTPAHAPAAAAAAAMA